MITIVSGLPRSGTSLMMQMLVAGGMEALFDDQKQADADNPRGYFEWERIKQLPKDPGCIAEAEGKVVKVVSRLLLSVPESHECRVLFMRRPLAEVIASQNEIVRRRGTYKEGTEPARCRYFSGVMPKVMSEAFEKHLQEVYVWLDDKPHVKMLPVEYLDVLIRPRVIGQQIADFLGMALDVDAMERQVDHTLYRNRQGLF